MPILPRTTAELLVFCQQHIVQWTTNAADLGLLPAQTVPLGTATTTLASVVSDQAAAEQAARVAVQNTRNAAFDLRAKAADCLRLIKAFAESQPDPKSVYALAEIPAPAAGSPMPPPGLPFEFRTTLDQDGRVELRWKCANPVGAQGTVYIVQRRLNGAGGYQFAAAVGERKFVDASVPFGTSQVDYRITGQRAGKIGQTAIWTVRFGATGGGLAITQSFGGAEGAGGTEGAEGGAEGQKQAA